MPNLKLISASFRNFGSILDSEVKFPESGFVLVNGINNTGTGLFSSVGAGKTLLGEGISKALFDVSGRYSRYGDYSPNGRDTYVKVEALLEGKKLLVEHGFKCQELNKTGEGFRFTLDGQPIQRALIKDTRDELAKALGMTQDVAAWTVYVDGSKLDFGALAEKQAVSLLMGALNLPPWEKYKEKARKVLTKFSSSLESTRINHTDIKEDIGESEADLKLATSSLEVETKNYAQAVEMLRVRNEERAGLLATYEKYTNEANASIAEITRQIRLAEQNEADEYTKRELILKRAESAITQIQTRLAAVTKEEVELQGKVNQAAINLGKAKNDYTLLISRRQQEANKARDDAIQAKKAEKFALDQLLLDTRNQISEAAECKRKKVDAAKTALHSANHLVSNQTLSTGRIALAVERLDQPDVCPLPGCGREWPKQPAKVKELEDTKKRLGQAKADLDKFTQDATDKQKKHDEAVAVDTGIPQLEAKEKGVLASLELAAKAISAAENVPVAEVKVPVPAEVNEAIVALDEADKAVGNAHLEIADIKKEISEAQGKVDAAKKDVDALKEASQVKGLSHQIEELQQYITTQNAAVSEIKQAQIADRVSDVAVSVAKARVEEKTASIQKLKDKLESCSKSLIEIEQCVKATEYWIEAFGPTGIPNAIINESIEPLNAVSRRVCATLTGGLIDIQWSTSRELAMGGMKNELLVTQNNRHGAKKVCGNSKGEGGISDLVVAETLAEVGNVASRIGYRFYDEITRSEDSNVRTSIFSYLRELSRRLKILILVTDHSPEVANFADYILVAEKSSDKGTQYRWSK